MGNYDGHAKNISVVYVQRVRTALPDVLHSVAQEGGGTMLGRLAASVTATAADMATRLGVSCADGDTGPA